MHLHLILLAMPSYALYITLNCPHIKSVHQSVMDTNPAGLHSCPAHLPNSALPPSLPLLALQLKELGVKREVELGQEQEDHYEREKVKLERLKKLQVSGGGPGRRN